MAPPQANVERRSSPRFTAAQLDVHIRAPWLGDRNLKAIDSSRAGVLVLINGDVPAEQFTGHGQLRCGSRVCECAFRVARVHPSARGHYVGIAISPDRLSVVDFDRIFPPTAEATSPRDGRTLTLTVSGRHLRWIARSAVTLLPLATYALPLWRWLLSSVGQPAPRRFPVLPFVGIAIATGSAILVIVFAVKLAFDVWRNRISMMRAILYYGVLGATLVLVVAIWTWLIGRLT